MPMISIRSDQKAYLERVSREASRKMGRKIGTNEVAQLIFDLCIQDEAIYETRTSSPVQPDRRDIYKAAAERRSTPLTLGVLLSRIT